MSREVQASLFPDISQANVSFKIVPTILDNFWHQKENSCNCNLHNLTRNQNENKINLFIDKQVYFIAEKLFLI